MPSEDKPLYVVMMLVLTIAEAILGMQFNMQ